MNTLYNVFSVTKWLLVLTLYIGLRSATALSANKQL